MRNVFRDSAANMVNLLWKCSGCIISLEPHLELRHRGSTAKEFFNFKFDVEYDREKLSQIQMQLRWHLKDGISNDIWQSDGSSSK